MHEFRNLSAAEMAMTEGGTSGSSSSLLTLIILASLIGSGGRGEKCGLGGILDIGGGGQPGWISILLFISQFSA